MRLDLKSSPAQRAALALQNGCTITFTSTPDLSGTYAVDATTLEQVGSVARDAASGLGLPFGQETFTYPDKDGTPRTFDTEQVQILYKVLRDYVAAISYVAAGRTNDLPTQPVVVP